MENEAQSTQPEKKQPKKSPVNPANYAKYTDLKFLQLSGAKLKDEVINELKELEKEIKGCSGRIAKRTVRAAIKNEQALMVEGLPVTEAIEALVKSTESEKYYFV